MLPLPILADRIVMSCILLVIASSVFLAGYGILRLVHISVDWVVWVCGFVLIVASLALGYAWITATLNAREMGFGNELGAFSFYISAYASGQWVVRHWYLIVKRWRGSWLAQRSRTLLIFVRQQHIFFGWVIAACAVAHMVVFLPHLREEFGYEIITGFIAIGILVLSVLLGLWIWYVRSMRKQRMPQVIYTIHSLLSIAFLIAVAIHI